MNENAKTAVARNRGLGKGLAALLGDSMDGAAESPAASSTAQRTLPIEFLTPCPLQPRRHFEERDLAELAESIRENGILQPLLVRHVGAKYEIVAGERRWRAAQRAGLHELPVVERTIGDEEALQLALVENLQREDLNPLEEADAYRRLIEDFRHRQEDVAAALGKSRSHIANTVRLLNLPEEVRGFIENGTLSAGHARCLLGAQDPLSTARVAVQKGLNVRQTELLAKGEIEIDEKQSKKATKNVKDPNTRALEDELARILGLSVKVKVRGEGGTLSIGYQSVDQLDGLLKKLRI
jgi:ParB family chromosome partitioning protein